MIDCSIISCFQETAQNLSWREYTHNFVIESEWESSFVMAIFNIQYELGGSTDPGNGPSGTYDLTITDPDGTIHGDGYTMGTWDNKDIDETISEVGTLSLMLGFLSSVITSYFSINILLNLIKKQQFHYFTPYCILLGFLLIYTSLF